MNTITDISLGRHEDAPIPAQAAQFSKYLEKLLLTQRKSVQRDCIYPSLTRETNSSEDGEKVGVPDPGPDDMAIVMFRHDKDYSRFI